VISFPYLRIPTSLSAFFGASKRLHFGVLEHILISQNEAILTEIDSSPLHLQHTCTLQNLKNAGGGGVLQ
jgi:hypothetical protein